MKIFYFTSTGNSLALAKQFDAELYSIPQLLKTNEHLIFEDTKIGFIFPTYAYSTPQLVINFLQRITLKSPYIFVVTTNEGGTGGAISQFIKAATNNNITISYSNSLTTIGNYLPLSAMEKNNTIANLSRAEASTKIIVNEILSNTKSLKNNNLLLGSFASGLSKLFDRFARKTAKSFVVENHCNTCGTCGKVCPKNNIVVSDTVSFNNKCISCYGCTHNCPQNAIRVKGEKSKSRYRNIAVSLNDIIEANNQI